MESLLGGKVMLHPGDCREVLPQLDECSIDACVTDPPYHLTSIVKRFGSENAAPAQYGKDGAFSRASRGFMGKVWDGGDIAFRPDVWLEVFRVLKPGGHVLAFGGTRTYHRMACAIEDAGFEIRDCIQWLYGSGFPKSHNMGNGWGTALKPACEPIVLARKPLSESTVAGNVLKWGTGAINVDGCRVHGDDAQGGEYVVTRLKPGATLNKTGGNWRPENGVEYRGEMKPGRWPANVLHDGSEEVVGAFPETGVSSGGSGEATRNSAPGRNAVYGSYAPKDRANAGGLGDSGSSARFFYTAKADSDDRLGSKHPTVKPLDLMQYLIRLVTPKGGQVLDPFAGTGTTAQAAVYEGMRAVLIEREEEYQSDIRRRMALVLAGPDERQREIIKAKGLTADAGPLFAMEGS